MKVILLTDVPKLGRKFETKEVSEGHATNFLIPQKLAVTATPAMVKRYDAERAKLEGERKVHAELALKNLKELDGLTLSVSGKANEKGHLFAGLHREEIAAEVLKQTRLQIDPASIQLEHPIKEVGEHTIQVKVGEVTSKFTLTIIGA